MQASQVLLVIEHHPLTSNERSKQLGEIRRAQGEFRSLDEAPGHLLGRRDEKLLATLLGACIGSGSWWSVYIYLAPIRSTMRVWESSLIDLWSERHADRRLLEAELRSVKPR